jgi:hypothetical protein
MYSRSIQSSILSSFALVLVGFAIGGCGGAGGVGEERTRKSSAAVSTSDPPPEIAVPDGNGLAFAFSAVGVQIYTCTAVNDGYQWVFSAPRADLFDDAGMLAATHFAGPTWQANDGSSVVGQKIAAVTVDPNAIPWLLLRAASNTGDGSMSNVTFIQRLDTTNGLAPDAAGCDANSAGVTAEVGYTANYAFYTASP